MAQIFTTVSLDVKKWMFKDIKWIRYKTAFCKMIEVQDLFNGLKFPSML